LCFDLEKSTSASTLLLASIDGARRQIMRDGRSLNAQALAMSERLRSALAEITQLAVFSKTAAVSRPGAAGFDPTHVTIDVSGLGLAGYQAADWLFAHDQITFELMDHRRLMALVTFADNEATIDRLTAAVGDLAADRQDAQRSSPAELPATSSLRTETVMLPRDAFLGKTRHVPIKNAAGMVAAESVTPYPPGVPVLAPGEIVTDAVIDYLKQIVSIGAFIEGASDPSLRKLRVTV
jgi:arginine decarboxylase